MVKEFLNLMCNTECRIIAYSDDYSENGGPELIGEWIGRCNFQRNYKRIFSGGIVEDVLEGTLYVPVQYIEKNFQSGEVVINNTSYHIKSVIESYGIDGNIDFYIIKTM